MWLLNRAGGEADQADRRQGRRLRLRLVARQQAAGARRRATRIRRSADGADEDEGDEADEDAQADRHRSLSLQGGRRRLPARRALAPLSLRHRVEEGRAAHGRRVRRGRRRRGRPTAADRVHPPARRRRRRQGAEPRRRSSIEAQRRRAAAPADDDDGGRERAGWRGARTASRSPTCSATSRSTPPTTSTGWRSIPAAGGAPRMLTDALDRPVTHAVLVGRRHVASSFVVVDDRARVRRAGAGRRRRGREAHDGRRVVINRCRRAPTAASPSLVVDADRRCRRCTRSKTASCASCRTRTTSGCRTCCSARPRSSRRRARTAPRSTA